MLAVSVSSDNLIAELGDRQPGCGRGQRALQRKALLDGDRELDAHERTSPISASGLARGTSSCGGRRMRASRARDRRRSANAGSAEVARLAPIHRRNEHDAVFQRRRRPGKNLAELLTVEINVLSLFLGAIPCRSARSGASTGSMSALWKG